MYWNSTPFVSVEKPSVINRNMRCIEIPEPCGCRQDLYRLIETWDVLKSKVTVSKNPVGTWLIETWDVLKWSFRITT